MCYLKAISLINKQLNRFASGTPEVSSPGRVYLLSSDRWIIGKMSKLKEMDKMYFKFDKIFNIFLYVIAYKQRKGHGLMV